MNTPQIKIVELFDRLPVDDRQELAEHLYQRAQPEFLVNMSTGQRAELDAGLAEADRGEGTPEDDVFRRLEQKFGVKLG
jgi:putative addiction module component (TIGR02574 family)